MEVAFVSGDGPLDNLCGRFERRLRQRFAAMPEEIAWLFFFGLAFGLAAMIPPGPINTQIARRTVRDGFLPGLAFGAGSILVENTLAIVACLGYGEQFSASPRVTSIILFVGFMMLAIVGTIAFANGYRAWQDPVAARKTIRPAPDDPLAPKPLPPPTNTVTKIVSMPRAFMHGVGLAIISPYTLAFWLVILPSWAHDAIATSHVLWALPLGVMAGTSAWVFGFTAMLAYLKRYSSTGMWADLIGGALLLTFAAFTLLKLIRALHRTGDSFEFPL